MIIPAHVQAIYIDISESMAEHVTFRNAGKSDDPDMVYLVPPDTYGRWIAAKIALGEIEAEMARDWWSPRQDLIDARRAAWHAEHAGRTYCVECSGRPVVLTDTRETP